VTSGETRQDDLVEIQIVGMSLPALQDAGEHHDELFREFRLILSREPSPGHDVPRRLLDLIEELDQRFSGFSLAQQAELDAAIERGDQSIDLVYRLPREVREAVVRFAELLADADEYCRNGDLLTLAPPPEAVAFRNWFLNEFVAQIDGAPPTRWEG
jgi:hypothetical protein